MPRDTQLFFIRRWALVPGLFAFSCFAADWPPFRGPNGSGVGEATRLPVHFGPQQNVLWKTAVPLGHSSPVIAGDLIFLTGVENPAPSKADDRLYIRTLGTLYCFGQKE